MHVQQCDLADLPRFFDDAAKDARPFRIVIIDGNVNALFKASHVFRSHVGVPMPKLVLLSADSLEQAKHLKCDAILATPVRAKTLGAKLCELVQGAHLPEASPPSVASLAASTRGLRVLVTDDNLINQKLACALLTKLGCQVDTADNGCEAVAKATQNGYSMIFMDCVMPEMDGFEATKAIRNLAGQGADVPIVALTASATVEDRDHCLDVGMNDFLTKPIRSEQLAACLTKWQKAS
jgi:CheY-like chemotaxis protein